jgi:hypothetical protein
VLGQHLGNRKKLGHMEREVLAERRPNTTDIVKEYDQSTVRRLRLSILQHS